MVLLPRRQHNQKLKGKVQCDQPDETGLVVQLWYEDLDLLLEGEGFGGCWMASGRREHQLLHEQLQERQHAIPTLSLHFYLYARI